MWLYSLSNMNLLLFRTINKYPSLLMIREFYDYFYREGVVLFRIFNTFLVAVFMLTVLNTKILYLISSLLNSNWLMIRAHSATLLLVFMITYYASCAVFLLVEDKIINLLLLFSWSSLPGSPFFFFKVININFLLNSSIPLSAIFLFLNVIVVFGYMNILLKTFIGNTISGERLRLK